MYGFFRKKYYLTKSPKQRITKSGKIKKSKNIWIWKRFLQMYRSGLGKISFKPKLLFFEKIVNIPLSKKNSLNKKDMFFDVRKHLREKFSIKCGKLFIKKENKHL